MTDWLKRARESWGYNGSERPPFAVVPKEGERSVWDFPRPPAIEPVPQSVIVRHDRIDIAHTKAALRVLETASPPTYYIPPTDIDMSQLVKLPGKTSMCEWKGTATYWALKSMGNHPIAWSYPKPYPEFQELQDYLAFYPQPLECYVDGVTVTAQPGAFYAGWITPDLVGPFKGEPGTGHW
ncbi:DUF427 domain-containing protein [Gangjinia marincola]|uniref:DUF427 domain-containing protein n=1 Tax=Gangjinia marincola TaxID=578463 RepID=A0ABN1MDD7_9FLAO